MESLWDRFRRFLNLSKTTDDVTTEDDSDMVSERPATELLMVRRRSISQPDLLVEVRRDSIISTLSANNFRRKSIIVPDTQIDVKISER